MRILAIDSSGLVASVAVLRDGILEAEYTIQHKKTHSQTLLPMLDAAAKMIELDLHTLDAVAVAAGPGSFTGLRIGSATAKGLGLALDIPLVPVPTTAAMAYNCFGRDELVCPMMDARRSQVYTGIYRFRDGRMETVMEQAPLGAEGICGRLNELGGPVILLGDGADAYRDILLEKLEVPALFAPPHLARQRAGALASLAALYLAEGKTVTAAEHAPDYLRLSQAERERAKKLAAEGERQ